MMRPTRRGLAVAAVALLAAVMAWSFGPRALNALVAPALVGLGAGALQLVRANRPTVDRIAPEPGFVGERRELTLRIETRRPVLATVEERIPESLRPDRTRFETTIGASLSCGIEPDRRGRYEVGPLSVTITDALGLFVRRFRYAETTPILVYPEVRALAKPDPHELSALLEERRTRRRSAFDHVREYERGDALRDVHWKASAKRPDDTLVVKAFAGGTDATAADATVVATGERRHADALASATASVVTHLLETGIGVELRLADGRVEAGRGRDQRRAILDLLARTEGGVVDRVREPDVLVEATDEGVAVSTVHGRTEFERLVDGSREVPAA